MEKTSQNARLFFFRFAVGRRPKRHPSNHRISRFLSLFRACCSLFFPISITTDRYKMPRLQARVSLFQRF